MHFRFHEGQEVKVVGKFLSKELIGKEGVVIETIDDPYSYPYQVHIPDLDKNIYVYTNELEEVS